MRNAFIFVMYILVVSFLLGTVMAVLSLPVVSTDIGGNCISVINDDGSAGSCDNLPSKYHHQYVAPRSE